MNMFYDYIMSLEQPQQDVLLAMYETVKAMVPEHLEEASSYGMPAFKYNSRPLISFIVTKNHLSLFPFSAGVVEALKPKLANYELSKGTIRFSTDNPIPAGLLKEIVALRQREIDKA
jgi:uncharacterized protein YdhG (YjbR/CyaY superfamily)